MLGIDSVMDVDLWVEGFSIIITFIIAFLSFRAYRLTKEKRQLMFGFGFISLFIGQLLMFDFNEFVEIETLRMGLRGYLPIGYTLGIMLMAGMLAVLVGYMTIFIVNEKFVSNKSKFLLYISTALGVLVSHDFYFVYHLFAFLILAMVFNHYYWNSRKVKTTGATMTMLAFAGLMLSHAAMMFISFNALYYVLGHVIQLFSYALLLAVVINVLVNKK